jgi:hypothetical protein
MAKRYLVTLSEDERAHLLALTQKGRIAARQLTRAHILLQADAGVADTAMATALHSGTATGERSRTRVVEAGGGAECTSPPWGAMPAGGQARSRSHRAGLQYPA